MWGMGVARAFLNKIRNVLKILKAMRRVYLSVGDLHVFSHQLTICALDIGTEKAMKATDMTGFYAFFSARKSGNFLHILGPVCC